MLNRIDLLATVVMMGLLAVCLYVYVQGDRLQLKCVLSDVDGERYCVRDRQQVGKAVDLLAKTAKKCGLLVDYLVEKEPDKLATQRLKAGFNPKEIMETLPTSEYTAYSENKGEKLAFCLNKKNENNNDLIDEDTLMFVALHELAHIATVSIGHEPEFWENFRFLLTHAKEAGIHQPKDYEESPAEYCGMKLDDNPYYNR